MNTIKKNNLVEEAYSQILEMIATKQWQENEKLPSENEFSKILGVSRNTIRVALSKLNALGIVEVSQGFGYCVRNLNTGIYLNTLLSTMVLGSSDLESIIEFRIAIESETAAKAAIMATEEDIKNMKLACEKASIAMDNPDEFAKYDMEFHSAVGKASKNPLFMKSAEMIESLYTVWLMGLLRTHGMDKSKYFHEHICKAISDRNGDKARKYMREHLEDVLRKVKLDSKKKNMLDKVNK